MIIESDNLSVAWACLFTKFYMIGTSLNPYPLVIKITNDGTTDLESKSIRTALDKELIKFDHQTVNTVANTIFPQSLYRNSNDRESFFNRYRKKLYPRIMDHKRRNRYPNRNGTYFGRMIAYGLDTGDESVPYKDQLTEIIDIYKDYDSKGLGFRLNGLLAAIFDPHSDFSNVPRKDFPCLHQVQFHPCKTDRTLSVTGFYPTQTVFERAYGNYLGLWNLGKFMASELDLKMRQLVCFIMKPSQGKENKRGVADLHMKLASYIENYNELSVYPEA